ncbi:MAG: hypothetical protein RMX35_09665 [Nostoc sp. DcaGUA01]|nr:hypothetical protein [Nostoc sp. DcaGUA01]
MPLRLSVPHQVAICCKKYALALVALQERENEPKIQKLNKLLVHPSVKDFINKEDRGRLVPVF